MSWIPERALSVDTDAKTVTTAERTLPYDTLILATGSLPFVPPLANSRAPGCFVYRTLDDLDAIKAYAAGVTSGTVIGGGLLGLEAAAALQKLGLKVNVVEFAPRLMPAQIDDAGGALLRSFIEQMGIGVLTGAATQELLLNEAGALRGLRFADGSELETELLVFSAGIRPRDDLARAAGLEIGERGGIVIDDQCRTSDPDVYAVGECALHAGRIYGLVAPGYSMARAAAASIAGAGETVFSGADMSTKLKLLGVEVGSFGDAFARSEGARELSIQDNVARTYSKLVLSADGTRVLGGVLVGDTSQFGELSALAKSGEVLSVPAASLLLPQAAAVGRGPESDSVQLRGRAARHPARSGGGRRTRSGGAQVLHPRRNRLRRLPPAGERRVLNEGLSLLGQAVDYSLCEHFRYTRQELFDLIRVKGHRSWETVLEAHGSGQGCEVCKPAVASILASQHNEYILKDGLAPLQDTNDAYLANIQKNGTYSVMPRVPGGEITPEQTDGAGAGGAGVRAVLQDHRGAAHRPAGRAARPVARHLDAAGGGGLRERARLRQILANRKKLRRKYVVPLRRAGQHHARHRTGAALPGPEKPAQAEGGRVGLHPRVCRGAEQGLRTDRHRTRLEPVRGRQRRRDPAPRATSGAGSGRRDGHALPRPLPDVLRPHRRPPPAHEHLARQDGRRHRASAGRRSSRIRWGWPRNWRPPCATTSPPTPASGRKRWPIRSKLGRFRHFVNSDATDEAIQWVTEREQPRPAFEHELTPLPMFAND